MMIETLKFITAIILLFVVNPVFAATIYMGSGETYTNLRDAVAGISGGDTLIIRDGTYSGANNCLWQFTVPPNGTPSMFTTIKAEHDGNAIFVDGFINMNGSPASTVEYVSFEGLKSLQNTTVSGFSHCRFLRCAFTYDNSPEQSASAPFWLGGSCSYVLVEDCWAWGAGRYNFIVGGDHHVFRRCIARFDRTDWTDPMANFSSYDADYVAYQNCVAIDSDHEEFWLYRGEIAGNFYIHHGSAYNSINGCIGVNNHNPWISGAPGPGLEIKNSVAVDINNYAHSMRGDNYSAGNYTVENCTIIDVDSHGIDPWFGGSDTVSAINNVIYNSRGTALNGTDLGGPGTGYNVLYNNFTDYYGNSPIETDYCTANFNAIDPIDGNPGNGIPSILYPVRIEMGSDLSGSGSGSNDRGANILYKIGVTGTFYGETGWDTVTGDELWPFPNEDRIKTDMAAYTYTGATTADDGDHTLSGARGFCTGTSEDGSIQTLTKYIWEYLGNEIPVGIYPTAATIQCSGAFNGG